MKISNIKSEISNLKSQLPTLAALVAFAFACPARGQMATNTPSAAQPSRDIWEIRQLFQFASYEGGDIEQLTATTELMYGLSRDVTLGFRAPIHYRDTDTGPDEGHEFGQGDLHLMAQWRFWKHDSGPIDTQRLAVMTGIDLPTHQEPFGSDGVDPMIGLVYTRIAGRHGINTALRYMFTTDDNDTPLEPGESTADLLNVDGAYLYRITPAEYGADTKAAGYLVMEVNGLYETNGDHEVFVAPGFLWEARSWALEASVQLPVMQELDHRPEADFIVTFGFRVLF